MELSLWNSLDYLTLSCENWHTDFYFGYGREEDVLNEKACMQALRILISKADGEIRELEEDIVMLQCHLAWDDEDWSNPCSAALQEKVDWLDSSIKSLKKGITVNDFCVELEEPVKVPPRLHDLLKPLLENYFQVKTNQIPDPMVMVSSSNASIAKVGSREVDQRKNADIDSIIKKKATKSQVTHPGNKTNSYEKPEETVTKIAETVKLADDILDPLLIPAKTVPDELSKMQKMMVSNPVVMVSSSNASIAEVDSREVDERRSTDMDIISQKKATESRVTHQDEVEISSEEMETKAAEMVKFADAISDSHFNLGKIVPEELISTRKMMVSDLLISSAIASIAIVGAREIEERRSTDMDIISKKKATESRVTHQDKVAISSEEMETKAAEIVKFADTISDSHFNPGKNVPEAQKMMVYNPMALVSSANASIAIVGSREMDESRSTNMDIISKKKATESLVTHQDKVAISTEEMNTKVAETVKPADAILDSHLVPAKKVPEQLSKTEKTRASKHSTNENVVSRKPLVKQKGNQKNISERTMALETRATETTEIDSDSLLASYKHKRKRESKPKKKMENKPLGQLMKVVESVIINDVNPYHCFKLKGQEPKKSHEPFQNIELESPAKGSLKGRKKIEDLEEIMKKDVEKLTLRELKTIAKNRNLAGYSGLKKGELQKKLGLEPQEDLK